jgi:hypothetical protein
MAEHGISAETMLAGLQDIRLPAQAPGGLAAELLAVVGLGLALALVVSVILKLFMRPQREAVTVPPLEDRVAQLATLPDEERALALLSLIQTTTPGALPGLRTSLYTRQGFPEVATLEAILLSRTKADA